MLVQAVTANVAKLCIRSAQLIICVLCGLAANAHAVDSLRFDVDPSAAQLIGSDARLQLVVSRHDTSGTVRDVTHQAELRCEPAGVVKISETGQVLPIANGIVTLTAYQTSNSDESPAECEPASIQLTVSGIGSEPASKFPAPDRANFHQVGLQWWRMPWQSSGTKWIQVVAVGLRTS